MARSEAQKKADKKYHEKTYKTFSVNLKKDEYELFSELLSNTKQSKSGFIRASMSYAVENEDFRQYLESLLKDPPVEE